MPVKIRLARHGKKGAAYYHVVVADSRAPRDGKFIEKVGSYDPNTNPATITLDFEKALSWLQKGAQPTDTVRAILSYKGVLYKKHLLGGVAKGALTEDQAAAKFEAWLQEKADRISAKAGKLRDQKRADEKARLAEETKVKEEKAKAQAARKAAAAAEAAGAEGEEAAEEAAVAEEVAVVEEAVEEAAAVVEEVAVEAAAAEEVAVEAAPAEETSGEAAVAEAEVAAEPEKPEAAE